MTETPSERLHLADPSSGAQDERVRLAPPSDAMAPLVELAVAHVLDTRATRPQFPPTILAVADDGRRGMWALPDLTPEGAAEAVAALRPRPARAVAVFEGAVQTPDGPRPAIALETFEAGSVVSARLMQQCLPAAPGTDVTLRADGAPEVVANGPNPLASPA